MTYFLFLVFFVCIPLLIFTIVLYYIRKQPKMTGNVSNTSMLLSLFLMAMIALIYTPIWDNYLVGNNIWFYDSTKVIGITLGYVPIEEYAFFILQSLLIGVVFFSTLSLLSSEQEDSFSPWPFLNLLSSASVFLIWTLSLFLFMNQIQSLTYFALILLWSLPPIVFQLFFGSDIIKHRFKPILTIIVLSTLYLSIIDAIAIADGIWTITSNTSTGFLLGGILPIEEFVFFLVTNILIVMGLFLLTDQKSRIRIKQYLNKFTLS
ncbi:MAG: lycopene cyclase domain-containing protein [Candidatus Hodarchaeales archaeon]